MEHDTVIKDYSSRVRKVLLYTLILNTLVAFAKIFYGYMTDSIAMTSDGFHSLFDGVSNVIGLVGIWIASRPPDWNHPYGHRKYETLFTIIIAAMIFVTCFQILKKVYASLFQNHMTVVTDTSFAIMIFTVAVNVFVVSYESKKGRQFGSDFLIADAKHTKSDIFVSLSVIVSLVFTKLGYYFVDTVTGIIIVFLIGRIGYQIVKGASDVLVDTVSLDTSTIENIVNRIEGVRGSHDIRTRGAAHSVYVDLHALVDSAMSVEKAHGIADRIEDDIKKGLPSVIDVVVHIEPDMPKDGNRTQEVGN